MEGYFRALEKAGIECKDAWIERGEGRFEFGYQATHHLLDLPAGVRPSAVISLNDAMATGAIWAAKERGLRVGKDFAISGFDDAPMVRYFDPPLTTIHQPIWEVGQRIIPMLLEIISSRRHLEPSEILVEPALIVRSSTTGEKVKVDTGGET
jgi:DNA-binding LacI/PurR family transcriptional regulator